MKSRQGIVTLGIFAFFSILFSYTQSSSIFGGDAGDLVTAAYTGGVAHPPGYPLYTFLGYILSHTLSIGTVAWRIGLISSISLALALTGLFAYISNYAKSMLAGIVAVGTIGLSYLYWLYAIVPEVFALHILFVVFQMLTLHSWLERKSRWAGIEFIFLFILSLSHHHIILFMVPSYLFLLYSHKLPVKNLIKNNVILLILSTVIALLPLFWLAISINSQAIYTWQDTLTLNNFIKLLTRASYGSFSAATIVVESPFARLMGVYAYFVVLIEDITLPAFAVGIAGAIYEYMRNKRNFYYHTIAYMCTGPIYFLYAGYILTNSFTIATFERFLMPSYVIFAIWIGMGVVALFRAFESLVAYIRVKTSTTSSTNYYPLVFALCMILPINLFFINFPKLSVLRTDMTAEKLAMNILDTADKDSIVLLSNDNDIFNAAYIRYASGYRNDLIVANRSHLVVSKRFKNIAVHYPELKFPKSDDRRFGEKFTALNSDKHAIYTNEPYPISSSSAWIREGVLYKLYDKNNLPPIKELLKKNDDLWAKYYDPMDGSLSKYKHLMLATNLLIYRMHRYETGNYFLAAKDLPGAERHFLAALRYDDNDVKVHQKLALVLLEQEKCERARTVLSDAHKKFPKAKETALLFVKLYTECQKDNEKAKEWTRVYTELLKDSQQKLE